MAERLTLDQLVGVRIPGGQPGLSLSKSVVSPFGARPSEPAAAGMRHNGCCLIPVHAGNGGTTQTGRIAAIAAKDTFGPSPAANFGGAAKESTHLKALDSEQRVTTSIQAASDCREQAGKVS